MHVILVSISSYKPCHICHSSTVTYHLSMQLKLVQFVSTLGLGFPKLLMF